MTTLSIYECADHREFLKKYLIKNRPPGGLRGLARRAGFKSPGHLAMLVSGKRRLTLRSAELLARAFSLRGRQRSLMFAYAKADSAKSEQDKIAAQEEILKLKSAKPQHQITAKQYAFLAVWYYPVLFSLIHQKEIPQDSVSLAERLGRRVSVAAIEKALMDLRDLNLIAKNQEARWEPVHTALTTPEGVRAAAIGQYHRNSIALSQRALGLPLSEREFNGLTISIPDRLLPVVKERIRRFRTELNELLAHETDPGEVYQLNLHLFPLTQRTGRKSL